MKKTGNLISLWVRILKKKNISATHTIKTDCEPQPAGVCFILVRGNSLKSRIFSPSSRRHPDVIVARHVTYRRQNRPSLNRHLSERRPAKIFSRRGKLAICQCRRVRPKWSFSRALSGSHEPPRGGFRPGHEDTTLEIHPWLKKMSTLISNDAFPRSFPPLDARLVADALMSGPGRVAVFAGAGTRAGRLNSESERAPRAGVQHASSKLGQHFCSFIPNWVSLFSRPRLRSKASKEKEPVEKWVFLCPLFEENPGILLKWGLN